MDEQTIQSEPNPGLGDGPLGFGLLGGIIKNYPLMRVLWIDACNYTERYPIDHDFTLIPVATVGHLLKEDEEKIVLFRDSYFYGPNQDQLVIDGTIVIPKGCIKKREIILEEKP